jgi:hypothetical protein
MISPISRPVHITSACSDPAALDLDLMNMNSLVTAFNISITHYAQLLMLCIHVHPDQALPFGLIIVSAPPCMKRSSVTLNGLVWHVLFPGQFLLQISRVLSHCCQ